MLLSETLITKKLIENSKYLFLFLPLFFIPLGSEFFEFPKYLLILVFSFASFVSLKFKEIRLVNLATISLVFYIAINFISSIQIFFKESFFGIEFIPQNSLLFILSLLIVFLFFSQKKFPKGYIKTLESYFLVGIFISAVLGVIQFIISPFGIVSNDWYFDGRVVSTLGHPNFLGAALVVGLLVLRRANLPWVYLTLLLCLILTFSKTSIILYFIFTSFFYIKDLYFQNKKIAITLALTIFTFLTFIGFGLFSKTYERIISNNENMYQFQRFFVFLNPQELFLDLRFKIWGEAFNVISDSPYLGFGKGQIIRLINLPEFEDKLLSSTHNLYIDIALESGLLGLTAFLIFLIASLINSYNFDKNLFLIQFFIVLHALFDITPVLLWFIFFFIAGISLNKYNKDYFKQL